MPVPRVSVVVPAYNAGRYIAATLRSIQAQTLHDFEVVVVDDGSTDDTPQVVQPFLADSRFTLVHQANGGLVAARNAGLSRARGPFVAFLDADDAWRPTLLERAMVAMRDPRVGLYHGDALTIDEAGREGGPIATQRWRNLDDAWRKILLRQEHVVCPTNVVRRAALPDPAFDERFNRLGAEDRDLWLSILAAGWTHHYDREVVALYRTHAGSMSRQTSRMLQARLRLAHKHARDATELRSVLAEIHLAHGDEIREARLLASWSSYARAWWLGAGTGRVARHAAVAARSRLRG